MLIFLKSNAVSSDKYLPVLSSNHAVVVSTSSLVASYLLCRHVRYFILIIATHRQIGQQVSGPVILSNPTSGEVNKVLGSNPCDCSIASSSSSTALPRLVFLLVTWTFHVIVKNEMVLNINIVFSIPSLPRNKRTTISLIMSFMLFFLICLDIVLLVHVLILIDMMRMFRSIRFLYTFVVMVLLYFWIKLKPNVSNKPKTLF